MFKVGDKVKASDWFMKEYESNEYNFRWWRAFYNATKNKEEIIVIKRIDSYYYIYCESFTSNHKIWRFFNHEIQLAKPEIQLAKNDGRLRFTYSEVPPGTEYSNFLAWSKKWR